jgi:Fe-S-cluster containining protein
MDKKFLGKIIDDPWESLAKGPREVMQSIWEKYLVEVLGASLKSGRVQKVRREIEKQANFPKIFQDWNNLSPQDRAKAWRPLMMAAKEKVQAAQDRCVRCGECCEISSPTLFALDLALFQKEILTWNEVYTLRPGEQVTSREGKPETLREERLKIREVPGSRQCWFYQAATQVCNIYENRPEQCRRQNCWGEPAPEPAPEDFLTRRTLLSGVPEVWDLVQAHTERCASAQVSQGLRDLAADNQEGAQTLFEALHFDHYLRQMLINEWELSPAATEFLLGRPLTELLLAHGLKAAMTPEGVFRLGPGSCGE